MTNNISLLGHGYWGKKIAGVLDTFVDQKIIEKYTVYDIESKLEDIPLTDPIIIATPTSLHYEHARYFLSHGCHAFLEKPAAQTTEQISELIDICRLNKATCFVNHIYDYHPAFDRFLANAVIVGKTQGVFMSRTGIGRFRPDSDIYENLAIHDFTLLSKLGQDIQIDQVTELGPHTSHLSGTVSLWQTGKETKRVPWCLRVSARHHEKTRSFTIVGTTGETTFDEVTERIHNTHFYQPDQNNDYGVESIDMADPKGALRASLRQFVSLSSLRGHRSTLYYSLELAHLFDEIRAHITLNNLRQTEL